MPYRVAASGRTLWEFRHAGMPEVHGPRLKAVRLLDLFRQRLTMPLSRACPEGSFFSPTVNWPSNAAASAFRDHDDGELLAALEAVPSPGEPPRRCRSPSPAPALRPRRPAIPAVTAIHPASRPSPQPPAGGCALGRRCSRSDGLGRMSRPYRTRSMPSVRSDRCRSSWARPRMAAALDQFQRDRLGIVPPSRSARPVSHPGSLQALLEPARNLFHIGREDLGWFRAVQNPAGRLQRQGHSDVIQNAAPSCMNPMNSSP